MDRQPWAVERPDPALHGAARLGLGVLQPRGCVCTLLHVGIPGARCQEMRTHLSAWRQISGGRWQQAACRCRAPGSHCSQRASGRAGTGCWGRSAAGRREVMAAMPVAARTSPVTAASSLCSSSKAAHQGPEQQLHCKKLEKLGPEEVLPGAVHYWFWLAAL